MPKVEGYTDEQIFEIATKFSKETNRVYIAEALEILLGEAQNKVLEFLSSPVLADESFVSCGMCKDYDSCKMYGRCDLTGASVK